jgi:hypothetical protein
MKYIVTDIIFDTDGEEVCVPKTLIVDIPSNIEEDEIADFISDEISNQTGFCHKGFTTSPFTDEDIEELKQKHESIRSILIEYGNEEYGDCIIDEISEVTGILPTTVYYEE